MTTVTMDKVKLLEIIRNNRRIHNKEVVEAAIIFRQKAIEDLKTRLKEAEGDEDIRLDSELVKPLDYTKSYDQVISMLELEVKNTVELQHYDFTKYVLDEWEWMDQWKTVNSSYK